VYSGTNVVVAAGATYEITPDTDGAIAGTLVISADKAGYQIQGATPGPVWTTVVVYAPKNGTYPVVNNGTRIKNPLSSSITITYTLTCVVTYGPFVSTDVDDSSHASANPIYEWWYFDANFTNGYSATVVFYHPLDIVSCAIYDPQGNKVSYDIPYTTANVSTTKCDVQLGTGNRFWGSYPEYDIECSNGTIGVDLHMHSMVEGFKTPPTGKKQMTTTPDTWMGWVIAVPRGNVTGTITINGTPMTVTGTGYHDHNWGNTTVHDLFDHWYWGRIFLPNYTMVYSVGNMTDELGGGANNVWLTFKDHTLYDLNLYVTGQGSNWQVDPVSGASYPLVMSYNIPLGTLVHGTVVETTTQMIEIALPWGAAPGEGRMYTRHLSSGDIDLVCGTQTISTTQPLLHELMIP
jgi:hypothetical protein